MSDQQYAGERFRAELNRRSTSELKAITAHLGETNLNHVLNKMISSLFASLKLDEKETTSNRSHRAKPKV